MTIQIDVTELLSDSDFVGPISLITRTATVNAMGENVVSEVSADTVGSVQPASGKAIQRLPEALRVANVSSFWVKGNIPVTNGSTGYPAILVFNGLRYQVQTVLDWTNWGAGWCEGTCVVETPSGS